MIDERQIEWLLKLSKASKISSVSVIQELWSGYGQILRVRLDDGKSLIVKKISWPEKSKHPRGWNSNISHQRKVRSYDVELNFYKKYAGLCSEQSRIPSLVGMEKSGSDLLLVLEDLDQAGFDLRRSRLKPKEFSACIRWLANFHAKFLGVKPDGLWKKGSYWHLDTRPEELKVLQDKELKEAAAKLDRCLISDIPLTLIHGDAKVANFCFGKNVSVVAAVDFQYVGGGCGIKDLAYFVGSCLEENECEAKEEKILEEYFGYLNKALLSFNPASTTRDLEKLWRPLYPVAWADFHRFLKGWSPGHWKINSYSEKMKRRSLEYISRN